MSKNKLTEKYIEFNSDEIPRLMIQGLLDEFSSCWNKNNPNKTFYIMQTKQWKDGTIARQRKQLLQEQERRQKERKATIQKEEKQNKIIGTVALVLIGTPIVILMMIGGLNNGGSYGGGSYGGSSAGYNDSVPSGMSRAESNYIGNSLSEQGYSEQEAKEMRELINTFNELQKN